MKIFVYLGALVIAVVCIALALELGLRQYLPEAYKGYLIQQDDGTAKWAIGPFEPEQPAKDFNAPVSIKKPDNTIRIVSLGTSGTEGWLSAKPVFNLYGLKSEPKNLSSYSRAIEFTMNQIAVPSSQKIEVINLGVAAYNITDVIRMAKDSLILSPDMFIIQIGGNETWTAERAKWSATFDTDIPYLYAELGYELISGIKAGWITLSSKGNGFNPLALFSSKPQPIVLEPAGRAPGLKPRLENYQAELQRLGTFLKRKQIPTLFLIPSQNLADFLPFGSMAEIGTDDQKLAELNRLLLAALAAPRTEAKSRYQEILKLDDGIAEANFQLGQIYLQEQNTDKARELLWKANDRDLVLKRLPGDFHDISRTFVKQNSFPYIDEMKFFESKSLHGVVGYNWLDDDVHPSREAQFDLANQIVKSILDYNLLAQKNYSANLQKLPTFDDYNRWTGFDQEALGKLAYLKGAHNYLAFGRLSQRLRWDPNPARFVDPVLADLEVADRNAPSDQSLLMTAGLNMILERQDNVKNILASMNCRSSTQRGTQVYSEMMGTGRALFGYQMPELKIQLEELLKLEGCSK